MKTVKQKRWMKVRKKDHKPHGLIEGGAMCLGEKPHTAWLTLGAELPGFKECQFKRAFDRNVKILKCEEVGTQRASDANARFIRRR